jgi:hypothetical protein
LFVAIVSNIVTTLSFGLRFKSMSSTTSKEGFVEIVNQFLSWLFKGGFKKVSLKFVVVILVLGTIQSAVSSVVAGGFLGAARRISGKDSPATTKAAAVTTRVLLDGGAALFTSVEKSGGYVEATFTGGVDSPSRTRTLSNSTIGADLTDSAFLSD